MRGLLKDERLLVALSVIVAGQVLRNPLIVGRELKATAA
jgi:hypothetical protein